MVGCETMRQSKLEFQKRRKDNVKHDGSPEKKLKNDAPPTVNTNITNLPIADNDELAAFDNGRHQPKTYGGVELSPEQEHIVNLALDGHHVFFTGPGGVGKSLTLKALIRELRLKHGNSKVFVTASTGIAACNIGGTTLHSFAGVGLGEGTLESLVKKVQKRADAKKRWITAQVLIIDEISMIDPEFFEILDLLARRLRSTKSGLTDRKHHLFGGIQIILAGDFLQLPYVQKDVPSAGQVGQKSSQVFLFETKTWKLLFPDTPSLSDTVGPRYGQDKHADNQVITVKDLRRRGHIVNLTKVFRQSDETFVNLLHSIRLGEASSSDLDILRQRVDVKLDCSDGIQPTRLYPHRADVQRENNIELHFLDGDVHTFTAKEVGDERTLAILDKQCQAPRELQLKVGAQVVLLRNLDFARRLVNGSRGVITNFVPSPTGTTDKVPEVKFACGVTEILEPAVWEMESGGVILCSRQQIPLALCWASSIHKAMGMTLDKVETRLDSVFEYGQLYTALSRVTSLEGLCLLRNFDENKVMAHPRVVEFYQALARMNP